MFNPFGKKISELSFGDLNTLIDNRVYEGWFVEYKKDFISSKKLAQSIAAFANSEGGWFIIGIDDDINNSAIDICGFDLTEHKQPKEQIRDVIFGNISPTPKFETQLIEIDNNRAVLVIEIEKGFETPYLTKDGKIYRRVSEGKEPTPEIDRYTLQRLFERKNANTYIINNFSENRFYEPSKEIPFIELYFYTLPIGNFKFNNMFEEDFFNCLNTIFLEDITIFNYQIKSDLRFDNISTFHNSYILRNQFSKQSTMKISTTIEIFNNGMCKMIIPMKNLRFESNRFINSDLFNSFKHIVTNQCDNSVKIFDGFNFLLYLQTLLMKFFKLLTINGFEQDIGLRVSYKNILGILPYFHSIEYMNYIKKYGMPISIKNVVKVPHFNNDEMIIFKNSFDIIEMIKIINHTFGLPSYVLNKILDDYENYIREFRE